MEALLLNYDNPTSSLSDKMIDSNPISCHRIKLIPILDTRSFLSLLQKHRRVLEKQISQDHNSTTSNSGQGGVAKRSNWDVIEYYNNSGVSGAPTATSVHDFPDTPLENGLERGLETTLDGANGAQTLSYKDGNTVSALNAGPDGHNKPFIDKDEIESVMVVHSRKSWWNLITACRRIFRSHRFRNVQAEVLYQRYFLRMNQNNMASLLSLLIIISISMIAANNIHYSSPSSSLPNSTSTNQVKIS